MNREITTKKVGKLKKLTNPCPVIKGDTKVWWEVQDVLPANGLKENSRKMEKNISIVVYYSYQKNKIIEDRIREYYPQVKALIEMVITKRLRNPNTPKGLCTDFSEEDEGLWTEVIKPWFTPQRFNLEHVYFKYSNEYLENNKDGYLIIDNRAWLKIPLSKLNPYYLKNAFWFPTVKEYNPLRLDILEYALDDLERIHNRRVNLLFEFDKPIIG